MIPQSITEKELYVSVDIEADGPIPGEYSMISFGSAVFTAEGLQVGQFEANLEELPDAEQDPDTMKWWKDNFDAWEYCRRSPRNPGTVMHEYYSHLLALTKLHRKSLTFIGYPATYDFMFIYWYLIRFVKKSPFSMSGLDIKTMAMLMMKSAYRNAVKRNMPTQWFKGAPEHSHTPLQDAIGQGIQFCNMLKEVYQSCV